MATNPKDVPRHYYSLEEYFALEQASDARFEYWDGDLVCMSGGSRAHGMISSNVHFALATGVRGGRCRAFTGDMAVWTPALPPYRYPDASVACGELDFKHIKGHDALVNPVLVVEVTSPSTVGLDEGPKFVAYQAIPTLRDYLLVSQDEARVTHYTRRGEGSVWERRDVTDMDASIELESIGCALKVRDIYEGLTFPA
ncbi:MAG TPA: Uma2 family endonuclease [Pyrinomonadaceae bacterium]|jgi:Uma2 family endonuclease|nr:Uma2 family endonuclease [Pyrinomonadaceae bacterium]